jgi:hypothetical protein
MFSSFMSGGARRMSARGMALSQRHGLPARGPLTPALGNPGTSVTGPVIIATIELVLHKIKSRFQYGQNNKKRPKAGRLEFSLSLLSLLLSVIASRSS